MDPIWDILERVNVGHNESKSWKGVFTERGVPDQTLLLMIDTVSLFVTTVVDICLSMSVAGGKEKRD